MTAMNTFKTHDLGQGWFANMHEDETMTLRNADKGLRMDLDRKSVATLAGIFKGETFQTVEIEDGQWEVFSLRGQTRFCVKPSKAEAIQCVFDLNYQARQK